MSVDKLLAQARPSRLDPAKYVAFTSFNDRRQMPG